MNLCFSVFLSLTSIYFVYGEILMNQNFLPSFVSMKLWSAFWTYKDVKLVVRRRAWHDVTVGGLQIIIVLIGVGFLSEPITSRNV